tara:strand:- start:406 stop:849 length:444 start_codon:yes stop_codon:yes gene_type:complete
MNLPYAASDTFSFLLLIITFSLIIIGFGIIIFLNILYINKNKTKSETLNIDLLNSLSELKERFDALNLLFTSIKNDLDDFKTNKVLQESLFKEVKSEITRIADGISGQDIMTKAIDIARNGGDVNRIISETGLSKSDAEALIKFHKN